MIDYKYPTIASGATPIGSAGRATDEELLWEERGRKFQVHGLNIYSHRERKFQEVKEIEDFRKLKFAEVEVWRSQRYMKSKIEEIKEVED
jgi:hypothetical protein